MALYEILTSNNELLEELAKNECWIVDVNDALIFKFNFAYFLCKSKDNHGYVAIRYNGGKNYTYVNGEKKGTRLEAKTNDYNTVEKLRKLTGEVFSNNKGSLGEISVITTEQYEQLKKELEKYKNNLTANKRTIAEMGERINKLIAEVDISKGELESANDKYRRLELESKHAINDYVNISNENKALGSKRSELLDENAVLKEEIRKLNADKEKLALEKNELEMRLVQFTKENNKLQAENLELRTTVSKNSVVEEHYSESIKIRQEYSSLKEKLIEIASGYISICLDAQSVLHMDFLEQCNTDVGRKDVERWKKHFNVEISNKFVRIPVALGGQLSKDDRKSGRYKIEGFGEQIGEEKRAGYVMKFRDEEIIVRAAIVTTI